MDMCMNRRPYGTGIEFDDNGTAHITLSNPRVHLGENIECMLLDSRKITEQGLLRALHRCDKGIGDPIFPGSLAAEAAGYSMEFIMRLSATDYIKITSIVRAWIHDSHVHKLLSQLQKLDRQTPCSGRR